MLTFLGFEEEVEDEAEEFAAPVAAQAGGGAVGATSRSELPRRPAPRPTRPAAWAEERGEARTSSRGATVTRLVQGLPGIVVAAPKRFDEAQEIADHLRSGKPVILHVDGLDRELTQRLVNFLAGSIYALGGEMHRVGAVVLFAPAGVDVTLPIGLRLSEREAR